MLFSSTSSTGNSVSAHQIDNDLAIFNSEEEFNDWFINYYHTKNVKSIVSMIKFIFNEGFFESDKTIPLLLGFMVGLFEENVTKLPFWLEQLNSLSNRNKKYLWIAVSMTNKKEKIKILNDIKINESPDNQNFITQRIEKESKHPLEIEIDNPGILDMLWGYFFATGSSKPIERISTALPWSRQRTDLQKFLIGQAAEWSLKSNARQHEKVRKILMSLKADENIQPCLDHIIKDIE